MKNSLLDPNVKFEWLFFINERDTKYFNLMKSFSFSGYFEKNIPKGNNVLPMGRLK